MVDDAEPLRLAVLGASGGVGRRLVDRALSEGHTPVCQTRAAAKLADLAKRVDIRAFDPTDRAQRASLVHGADAVIFALGVDRSGATTLFSEVTSLLIQAMASARVKRLIAITGVGTSETRGHGGFLYDRIIYPFFTRKRYQDKDRQEALIAASDLDWTIVRPAPFVDSRAPGPIEIHTRVTPDTVLRRITRDEVAEFVLGQVASDRYLRQRRFIGRP